MISREVVEGSQKQGVDEKVAYSITTTPWGAAPTNVSVVVKDMRDSNTVVTATVMPTGSVSVVGDVITLPLLQALTRGHVYRVEVIFTAGGNTFEPYFIIQAET